jgi:isoamylase
MLLGGDELGRTQRGNNNAYCQDNEVSWFDWEHVDSDLLGYVRQVIAMRRAHPVLRRRRYLADPGYSVWFSPDGEAMTVPMWQDPTRRAVAVFLDGSVKPDRNEWGEPVIDHDLLVLVNGHPHPVPFVVPSAAGPGRSVGLWRLEFDTALPDAADTPTAIVHPGQRVEVAARSLQVHWSVWDPVR